MCHNDKKNLYFCKNQKILDMEFIISSANLLKGALDVYKAVPAKTTLPILECLLFELEGENLTITASDKELTLRTKLQTDSTATSGNIVVPARQLIELLKALPDQPITIKSNEEGSFECKWSNGNSSLPYFPAEDYPSISGANQDTTVAVIPTETLLSGISNTIYATADDEMRPAMNGIFFDMTPSNITFVASDSHKLICFGSKNITIDTEASFILHKKPAGILKSSLDKEGEDVQIRFDVNTNLAEFTFGQTTMICRLIVGRFPDYRRVIPQNNSNILKIDRLQLLNTVRRVAVCANKASNHIKFDLKEGQLEITAQDLGFALAAYEKIECDYNGEEMSIGFKSSFLIDILSNFDCETLIMKFADPRRASLIVPSEEEEAKLNLCGILMPIMVS